MSRKLPSRLKLLTIVASLLALTLLLFSAGPVMAEDSECATCHQDETPGIVDQWQAGKMGQSGIDCSACHGSGHMDETDVDEALLPTPDTCNACHSTQVTQYREGKHAIAWAAMQAMPAWSHLPTPVQGPEGFKGCSGCHKIGEKPAEQIAEPEFTYGTASCDSCHTRHSFSKEEAQNPHACQTCHQGFDHPQWEMWSSSKHGTVWQVEGDTERAPTCQECHLSDGNHANLTAWGFLGLRLPEDDEDWLADRVVILQALGVLDDEGNPTARLDVVTAANVARLTAEEWQAERDEMLAVCAQCHSEDFAATQLSVSDRVLKEADDMMAEAILIVKGLYEDGLLQPAEGQQFTPDLLEFYSTNSNIENELFTMFLKYRNRTFMGAFHNNPDYTWWYGYAPMQKSLQIIKDEAASIRAGAEGVPGPQGPQGPAGPAGPAGEDAPLTILWLALAVAGVALILSIFSIIMRRSS